MTTYTYTCDRCGWTKNEALNEYLAHFSKPQHLAACKKLTEAWTSEQRATLVRLLEERWA